MVSVSVKVRNDGSIELLIISEGDNLYIFNMEKMHSITLSYCKDRDVYELEIEFSNGDIKNYSLDKEEYISLQNELKRNLSKQNKCKE